SVPAIRLEAGAPVCASARPFVALVAGWSPWGSTTAALPRREGAFTPAVARSFFPDARRVVAFPAFEGVTSPSIRSSREASAGWASRVGGRRVETLGCLPVAGEGATALRTSLRLARVPEAGAGDFARVDDCSRAFMRESFCSDYPFSVQRGRGVARVSRSPRTSSTWGLSAVATRAISRPDHPG